MEGLAVPEISARMYSSSALCLSRLFLIFSVLCSVSSQKLSLPLFQDLKAHYPGYYHHGGQYNNHHLLGLIGVEESQSLLIHDTSALRLSYALNRIGSPHSLGTQLIRLSKFGRDSIKGKEGLQYIYLPIAYGPFLADKYDYPTITKMQQFDPVVTEHSFYGKQGMLRVITYTRHGNQPKGHVALWDCNHFHQSKDWIRGHSLVTVEFWESPDSNCTGIDLSIPKEDIAVGLPADPSQSKILRILQHTASTSNRQRFLKAHILPKNARHSKHKLRIHGMLPPPSASNPQP